MLSAKFQPFYLGFHVLTHWGRVTHICIGNLTIIGSDNGLSPGRRQAITWTNVGILLIGPLGTNFSEMLSEIHTFSFKKIHLKMSSGKWRPFCLGLNVLTHCRSGSILDIGSMKGILWHGVGVGVGGGMGMGGGGGYLTGIALDINKKNRLKYYTF